MARDLLRMKAAYVAIAGLLAGIPMPAWSQDDTHAAFTTKSNVALLMKAEKEIAVLDKNGKKKVKRVEAVRVLPGDEVIYTVDYANFGKNPANEVVITNPIPEHMVYIGRSAETDDASVMFSVDGKHFYSPEKLVVRADNGKERVAKAGDYTHIRWVLNAPVEPGDGGQVGYRAVLQ